MKIKLDEKAIMPTRAHSTDAGLDIYSPISISVPPHGNKTIDAGVHIELPPGTAGMLKSKSGLNVNHNITSTGVIDEGYTGSIVVKLYNHGKKWYRVRKGDKVSQLLIIPILKPDLELAYELDDTDRGNSGFGSTGR